MLSGKEFLTKHFGTTDAFVALMQNRRQAAEWWTNKTPTDVCRLNLPYYAPGNHSPPIPTACDFSSARSDMLDPRSHTNHTVRRVFDKYVVKRSQKLRVLQEAETHLYLENHSSMNIPKLYAVFCDSEDNVGETETSVFYYVVTEYIEGFHLDNELFRGLDAELKKKAGKALGDQIRALRATPRPMEGYYGRVNHQGWPPTDILVRGYKDHDRALGPCDSYEEFVDVLYNHGLLSALRQSSTVGEYDEKQLLIFRNYRHIMLSVSESDRMPTLQHRDMDWGNMIFTKVYGEDGEVCDYKVTFIDYESVSWMPSWMGLAMIEALDRDGWTDFFYEAVKGFEPGLNLAMGNWLGRDLVPKILGGGV